MMPMPRPPMAPFATIRRYADRDELFIDLALGRLDLVISDGVAARSAFLDTELGAGFAFIGPELEAPQFFGEGEAIAVRKGDDELRRALNDALKRIRANGTLPRSAGSISATRPARPTSEKPAPRRKPGPLQPALQLVRAPVPPGTRYARRLSLRQGM